MDKSRSIKTTFWTDPYIYSLEKDEKLLYIYLMSNGRTNLAGIYELSRQQIMSETRLEGTPIDLAFQKFKKDGKILNYQDFIVIKNFSKHQNYNDSMMLNVIYYLNTLPVTLLESPEYLLFAHPVYSLCTDCIHSVEKYKSKSKSKSKSKIEDIYVNRDKIPWYKTFLSFLGDIQKMSPDRIDEILSPKEEEKEKKEVDPGAVAKTLSETPIKEPEEPKVRKHRLKNMKESPPGGKEAKYKKWAYWLYMMLKPFHKGKHVFDNAYLENWAEDIRIIFESHNRNPNQFKEVVQYLIKHDEKSMIYFMSPNYLRKESGKNYDYALSKYENYIKSKATPVNPAHDKKVVIPKKTN